MRREDLLSDYEKKYLEMQSKLQKNKLYKYWIKLWELIYGSVTVLTYLGMIVGLVMAFYYSIIHVELIRALLASGIVLLCSYVNRVNPK